MPCAGRGGLSFPDASPPSPGLCRAGPEAQGGRAVPPEIRIQGHGLLPGAASSESCLRVLPLPPSFPRVQQGRGCPARRGPLGAGPGRPGARAASCPGPEAQCGGRLAQAWSVGRGAAHLVSQHRTERLLFPNGSFALGLGESSEELLSPLATHSSEDPQPERPARGLAPSPRAGPKSLLSRPPFPPFTRALTAPPSPRTPPLHHGLCGPVG